jgi:acetyltransferase
MALLVGFPVAVKISSPKALHKTELGGVRLNLANAQSVREAFSAVSARARAPWARPWM